MKFERNSVRGYQKGSAITVTFPISKNDISSEEWTDKNMKFITALFEVYNNVNVSSLEASVKTFPLFAPSLRKEIVVQDDFAESVF